MLPEIIRKLIPRLASEHVGEAIATRDAIGLALCSSGHDWHDLARACCQGQEKRTPLRQRTPKFGDMARACRDLDTGRLSGRERDFVSTMCRMGFNGIPSHRQVVWLTNIFEYLSQRAA